MAIKPTNQVAGAAVEETNSVVAQQEQQAAATQGAVTEPNAQEAETQTSLTEDAPAGEDRRQASSDVLDEEEEQEAPASEPQKTQTATAVAAVTGTTAVSTSRVKGAFLTQIMEQLAEEGFEGTELDYSSFLNITLNKQIETSEGDELPNSGFMVRLASARPKYCFRNNNPVEDEVEVAYTYERHDDKVEGSFVHEKIKGWKEEGLDVDGDPKEYIEVLAVMLDDKVEGEKGGELNGKLITIQVAPTSKGRWAGYLTQLKMAGKSISDVQTLVRRGKKIESGKFPFFPWDFVNKGSVPAAE